MPDSRYTGTVILQSLDDKSALEMLSEVTKLQNQSGWDIYRVKSSHHEISIIQSHLLPSKFYAHFWNDKEIIVVYPNEIIKIDRQTDRGRGEAVKAGMKYSIPKQQLDFLIDE